MSLNYRIIEDRRNCGQKFSCCPTNEELHDMVEIVRFASSPEEFEKGRQYICSLCTAGGGVTNPTNGPVVAPSPGGDTTNPCVKKFFDTFCDAKTQIGIKTLRTILNAALPLLSADDAVTVGGVITTLDAIVEACTTHAFKGVSIDDGIAAVCVALKTLGSVPIPGLDLKDFDFVQQFVAACC